MTSRKRSLKRDNIYKEEGASDISRKLAKRCGSCHSCSLPPCGQCRSCKSAGTFMIHCLRRPECIYLTYDQGCSSLSPSVQKAEKFKIPKNKIYLSPKNKTSKKTCIPFLTSSSYSREDEDDECGKNKSYGSVETSVSPSSSESSSAPASPSSSLLPKYSYVPPIANGTDSSSSSDKTEDFKDCPLNASSNKTVESVIVNDVGHNRPYNSPIPSNKGFKSMKKTSSKNKEQCGKVNSKPKRFARCMKCDGCTSPACGKCSSCKIYSQFKDKIRDPVTCEQIVCKFPISLFQTSHKVDKSMRHEDGCCPLKVINGSVYDFRCYFCKFLPRVGSANRSELYRHYSTVHFQNELKAEFGNVGNNFTCKYCKKFFKNGFISHIGQTHNEVEKYLPEAARIPSSVQGHGRGVRQMRRRHEAGPVASRCKSWIFPEIPDGYDPNSNTREIYPPEEKGPVVVIDGFVITNEVDEDEEPIFCSREEPQEMPDYSGKCGRCELCHSTFSMIEDAVKHIQKNHGILGSQHLMLFADRLLKGGYISIPLGIVKEDITSEVHPKHQLDF